jgi:hypothetical protein
VDMQIDQPQRVSLLLQKTDPVPDRFLEHEP